MFAEELLPRLRALAEKACADEGLMLAWLELKRQRGGSVLRVFIDRAGSENNPTLAVGLDDCERVTHHLSVLLDVEDPIESSYTLEVSTPGLDRPLFGEPDFRRFQGKLAAVSMKHDLDGQRRFIGRLNGVEDGFLLLTPETRSKSGKRGKRDSRAPKPTTRVETLRLPIDSIDAARLEVEILGRAEGAESGVRVEAGGRVE